MRFELDNGTVVIVRFFYKGESFTVCEILLPTVGGDLHRIGRGNSSCNSEAGDTFCKRVGRKWALARALANADFNRAARTQIWKQYLARAKY